MRVLIIRFVILLGLVFSAHVSLVTRFAMGAVRRMSVILIVLLAVLGAGSAVGADWAANYGTTGADASTNATAVDAAGNIYIAGEFTGSTFTLGSVTLTKIGNRDTFVAKIDTNGSVAWAKNYGGSGATAYGNTIAVDSSGNVYLGGYFTIASLTTPALTKMGFYDAFAVKLDSFGNTTWAKNYGGSGPAGWGNHGATAVCKSIAVDDSGNVYLGGFQDANLIAPIMTKMGIYDAFAIKLDSFGNTTWAKNFGGNGAYAYGKSIAVDAFGNVYLGGAFTNANLTTPALTKIGTSDAFALKLDSFGNTTWAKTFGGIGAFTFASSIAVESSGNVYLGGYFENAITTTALTKIGIVDAFAIKLDSSGNTTWAKNYGGSGAYAYGRSISVDSSGNIYLGGAFMWVNLTTPSLTIIGNSDALIIKQLATLVSAMPIGALNLVPSWNLMGNSVNAPLDVVTTFGNVANVTTVWKWIPATSRWAFYAPSMTAATLATYAATKGYDVLTTINGGEGFWVNAKLPFAVTLPAGTTVSSTAFADQMRPPNRLPLGWSLIATGDNPAPRSFVNALAVTPPVTPAVAATSLTTLWAWNSAQSNWYFYAPSLDNSGGLANYITTKAYLNFGAKTLDPTMGFWVNHP